jgi:hypothetical protein
MNELAAVEITALAAGAGPPANKIPIRLKGVSRFVGAERLVWGLVFSAMDPYFRKTRRL